MLMLFIAPCRSHPKRLTQSVAPAGVDGRDPSAGLLGLAASEEDSATSPMWRAALSSPLNSAGGESNLSWLGSAMWPNVEALGVYTRYEVRSAYRQKQRQWTYRVIVERARW